MPFSQLAQLVLPEYRERHLFTARLRLAVFVGFWLLYLYFFQGVLTQLMPVTLIVAGSFLAVTLSYYWILKNRFVAASVLLEIAADLVTITAIIHVAEGPYSDFFTLYLFYIFAAGIFYNYVLALLIAAACVLYYGSYLLLCQKGIILPFILDWGDQIPIETHSPGYHFFFMAAFAVLVVYGVKVASFFGQKRERMLEARNKELSALTRMSATIRSTVAVEKVLEQILEGLEAGLELDLCALLLFDEEEGRAKIFTPRSHPVAAKAREIVGGAARSFPLAGVANVLLSKLRGQQTVFSGDWDEALSGLEPSLSAAQIQTLQGAIGFRNMVGIPLVAEAKLLGALLGFTKNRSVDAPTVKTLEAFASQAALVLESAFLIQRLREANRIKSEFLATMSHELRTPLTAIIGFSELLLEGVMGKLTEEQEESLREVLNNGATLLEMINNLLDMAKVEAGKMGLEPHPFDLRDLLDRVSNTVRALIHKKGQKLKLDITREVLPPLRADERKIQQILLNLLSNAIKFTPEGGEIRLGMRYRPNAFELYVKDTGIGIRPEHLSRVFDMFSQADSSVTRGHGGTGLGLTLAKQFVELHGGSIRVESEYGKGAVFTVILPQDVVG